MLYRDYLEMDRRLTEMYDEIREVNNKIQELTGRLTCDVSDLGHFKKQNGGKTAGNFILFFFFSLFYFSLHGFFFKIWSSPKRTF